MKKSLLVVAIAALSSFGAFAQNYYYYKTVGIPAGYTSTPPTEAKAIITGNATAQTGVLSGSETFPFSGWQFYGFTVNAFKVSTSGYISFDPSLTTDVTANTSLPNASAPKLSIFAFWDNTRIQTLTQQGSTFASDVKSWTYGTAPNREHVVQWRLVQTADGTTAQNVTYYAVLFHEAGGFDVILNYGFGTFSATVGAQNLDASQGIAVAGSPNMNFGGNNGSNDPKKSDVYHFVYGTQPAVDMVIKKNLTPSTISANANTSIKLAVDNYGANAITSAKMNYQIEGGSIVTAAVSASIAASGGNAVVTHPTPYVPVMADAGTSKTVKVWFSEINGGAAASEPVEFELFVNKGVTGTKKVLVEEGSGAWCGYCPDGHYILKDILNSNSGNVIGVVHHNQDGMANIESDKVNDIYSTGYPYGTVDRMKFDDLDEVGMNRGEWADKVAAQLSAPTPVNVSISDVSFDWVQGKVTYKVNANFVDYSAPGDIRIGSMIVENKVRGPKISNTSVTWNQRNYYSFEAGNQAGGESHPLFSEPAYIVGYWHNEVVRAMPSGAWGTAGVITNAAPDQSYSKEYTWTFPVAKAVNYDVEEDDTEYRSTKDGIGMGKYEDIQIVAFVSYYDANDVTKRQILNVAEAKMLTTGLKENAESNINGVSVYPNPASAIAAVKFDLKSGAKVEVEAVNVLGQKVANVASGSYAAGEHTVYFNVNNLDNGIYFVNVTTSEGKATYRFVVSK